MKSCLIFGLILVNLIPFASSFEGWVAWDFLHMQTFDDLYYPSSSNINTTDIVSFEIPTSCQISTGPEGMRLFMAGVYDFCDAEETCSMIIDHQKLPDCNGDCTLTLQADLLKDMSGFCLDDIYVSAERFFGIVHDASYYLESGNANDSPISLAFETLQRYFTIDTRVMNLILVKQISGNEVTVSLKFKPADYEEYTVVFEDYSVAWTDPQLMVEPLIIDIPHCAITQFYNISMVAADEVADEFYIGEPLDENESLSLVNLEARMAYLELVREISSGDVVCDLTQNDEKLTTQITLPILPSGDDQVKNLGIQIAYYKDGEVKTTLASDYFTIEKSVGTSPIITIELSTSDLIDLEFHMDETDELFEYSTLFFLDFDQTEDETKESILLVKLDFLVQVDRVTSQTISLQTTPLQEMDACNCVIRTNVGSFIKLYNSLHSILAAQDSSVTQTGELGDGEKTYQLGDTIYFQQVLEDEQYYRNNYRLELSVVSITYESTEYEYDDDHLTFLCAASEEEEYPNYSYCQRDIKASLTASMLGDLTIQVISLLIKTDTRRSLDETSEGVLQDLNFQITGTKVQEQETSASLTDKWWVILIAVIIGLAIIAIISILIIKKVRKDNRKQAHTEQNQPISAQI